jgi:hypothetical protein
LTGGNENGIAAAPGLGERIAGRILLADLEYDNGAFRRLSLGNNNIPVIPGRKNRRLAAQYEKSDLNFLEFILIVFIKIIFAHSP